MIKPNSSTQEKMRLVASASRRRPTRSEMLDLFRTGRHLLNSTASRCEGDGECIAEINEFSAVQTSESAQV